MSSVSIQGNASGTGIFTIQSPSSNTNRTISLPDNTGTILTSATTTGFPAGSVIQVVQNTYATETATNSSTYTDTGITATITPTSASSKILVSICVPDCGTANGSNTGAYGRYRIAKVISATTTEVTALSQQQGWTATTGPSFSTVSGFFLDSPSTTSAVEYKLQFQSGASGTQVILANDQSSSQPTGTITLMEIAA